MIVIAGRAGSGKDTLADYLCAHQGHAKVALADPMKGFCAKIFGWEHSRMWGESYLRNAPDPEWDGLTARHALQTLGTEWGRACHPDVWVRYLLRTAPERSVVSDIRFPNELAAFRMHGAYTVLLLGSHRPLAEGADHVSEATEWDPKDFDVVVPKMATAVDTYHYVRDTLERRGALL
jgi:hypothetical protein